MPTRERKGMPTSRDTKIQNLTFIQYCRLNTYADKVRPRVCRQGYAEGYAEGSDQGYADKYKQSVAKGKHTRSLNMKTAGSRKTMEDPYLRDGAVEPMYVARSI
jgi:hypothetical protein